MISSDCIKKATIFVTPSKADIYEDNKNCRIGKDYGSGILTIIPLDESKPVIRYINMPMELVFYTIDELNELRKETK